MANPKTKIILFIKMNKKTLTKLTFTLLLAFLTVPILAQQTAIIKGNITTSDGRAANHVAVSIKGRSQNIITDENGDYKFVNVKPGNVIIKVSAIGLASQEKNVAVSIGETVELNFVLIESSEKLQEITVTASKTNPFRNSNSESVAKMPLKDLENPQAYTTISQELLISQINTNVGDALKNSSGIDKLWSSTGRAGDGAAYYSLRGFSTQPTLINGVASLTNGDLDPSNIEKIEVIKGPSGTLFGGSLTSFGGLINVVTKRPHNNFGGSVAYNTGSYNLNRLTVDINSPLDKEGKLLTRVNGAYHYAGSFQDLGFRKSFFIAPTFEYKASDKLTFNLDAQFFNYEGTNPLMLFLNRVRPLVAKTTDELQFDFNRSYTSNDLTVKTPTTSIIGTATYKLSNQWTSQSIISKSVRKTDGYYQYVMYNASTDDSLFRYVSLQNSTSTSLDFQQNITGDFIIAGLRNRLTVGIDLLRQETNNSNSPYITFDNLRTDVNDPKYTKLNRTAVDAVLAGSTLAPTKGSTANNVYSAYIANVLDITDRLSVLASLRIDRFDNRGAYNQITNTTTSKYLQTALSPKFGIVYQIIDDQLSLFGNYQNGFKNVAPVTQQLPEYTGILKPQQADQLEGGIKLDILEHKLGLTASYYNIEVSNMPLSISVDKDGKKYNITVQDGSQVSKGVDFDLTANPIKGLNIVAGFSHNDSKMAKASAQLEGRRPNSAGPKNMVNSWVTYTFSMPSLSGFGIGFGGNYASKNLITNTLTTGTFTLPSYTVLNSTLFYNGKKFRAGVKVDNITDKTYFKGWSTVERQMPRNFTANLTLKF